MEFEDGLLVNYNLSEPLESPEFPLNGLVSYWKLDETSGIVIDELGTNNGANNGATRGVTGKIESAFEFDGSNDYVEVNDDASTNIYEKNISVVAWINKNDLTGLEEIVNKKQPGLGSSGWVFRVYDSNLTWVMGDGITNEEYSANSIPLNSNTWYLVAAIYDANNDEVSIYRNLDSQKINTSNFENINNTINLNIGARNGGDLFFGGIIDEIGIWNRTLTEEEIQILYNEGDGLSYPN